MGTEWKRRSAGFKEQTQGIKRLTQHCGFGVRKVRLFEVRSRRTKCAFT